MASTRMPCALASKRCWAPRPIARRKPRISGSSGRNRTRMEQLTGRVAFITGGASCIGLGMARAFLEEGMKVAIADWSDDHIARARDELAGSNAVHSVKTNVAERDSVRAA